MVILICHGLIDCKTCYCQRLLFATMLIGVTFNAWHAPLMILKDLHILESFTSPSLSLLLHVQFNYFNAIDRPTFLDQWINNVSRWSSVPSQCCCWDATIDSSSMLRNNTLYYELEYIQLHSSRESDDNGWEGWKLEWETGHHSRKIVCRWFQNLDAIIMIVGKWIKSSL